MRFQTAIARVPKFPNILLMPAIDALTRCFGALRLSLILLALCLPVPASAQIGASASLDSDYRFRGDSLSDERPALSFNVSYDHSSGAYIGGSATASVSAHDGVNFVGHTEYLGYVTETKMGPSLDFGISNAKYANYRNEDAYAHYIELYAGLVTDKVSAYIRYSANYFQKGADTIYIDLNGAQRVARNWRVFGHAGALSALSESALPDGRRHRYDIRAGIAHKFDNFELHMAVTAIFPQPEDDSVGAVLGATCFF